MASWMLSSPYMLHTLDLHATLSWSTYTYFAAFLPEKRNTWLHAFGRYVRCINIDGCESNIVRLTVMDNIVDKAGRFKIKFSIDFHVILVVRWTVNQCHRLDSYLSSNFSNW